MESSADSKPEKNQQPHIQCCQILGIHYQEGYINEFVVDKITSYSDAEIQNFSRTQGNVFDIFENMDQNVYMQERDPENGI